jgi:WD40 repeat protein
MKSQTAKIVTLKFSIKEHKASVYAISCDGQFLYSGSGDRFVTRWNLEDGTQDKFAIRFEHAVFALSLFDDNNKIAVGLENGHLHFFDLVLRKELKFYVQHPSGIFAITENQHKNHLYTSDADGNLAVWDTKTNELLLFFPFACGKIRSISLNETGDLLYLSGQDGYIYVLETNFFNVLHRFYAHKDGVTAIHLVENKIISGGKDAWLRVWNSENYSLLHSVPAHNFAIYDIKSFGKNLIVTASRDKTVKLWTLDKLEVLQRISAKEDGHTHSVNKVFVINENEFATCSDDKSIKLFSSCLVQ